MEAGSSLVQGQARELHSKTRYNFFKVEGTCVCPYLFSHSSKLSNDTLKETRNEVCLSDPIPKDSKHCHGFPNERVKGSAGGTGIGTMGSMKSLGQHILRKLTITMWLSIKTSLCSENMKHLWKRIVMYETYVKKYTQKRRKASKVDRIEA